MAKVKLGTKEFDVGSEVIDARNCGVSAADCIELAARMKTGEISRLKRLYLVRCVEPAAAAPCAFMLLNAA
jgi:hypothetical protein